MESLSDLLHPPAVYIDGRPDSPRLKKVGGLAADRRRYREKGDGSHDGWGRRSYRFGVPGTASGFYKPLLLEEAKATSGIPGAGQQPVSRDIERGYIEDPPIPKEEHVLNATKGQIKFGDANRPEGPSKKLSQTPVEMMNLGAGGMTDLSGTDRQRFFTKNATRREHLVETPQVQKGREWGHSAARAREERDGERGMDMDEVRMYERDVRRYLLKSRQSQRIELQTRSRQPTRDGTSSSTSGRSLSPQTSLQSPVAHDPSFGSSAGTRLLASGGGGHGGHGEKRSVRPFVPPTDGLAALDRLARGHGKVCLPLPQPKN